MVYNKWVTSAHLDPDASNSALCCWNLKTLNSKNQKQSYLKTFSDMTISLMYINGSNTICGVTSPPADILCSRCLYESNQMWAGETFIYRHLFRKRNKYFYCLLSCHYSWSWSFKVMLGPRCHVTSSNWWMFPRKTTLPQRDRVRWVTWFQRNAECACVCACVCAPHSSHTWDTNKTKSEL